MAQYIDKDALEAEIQRMQDAYIAKLESRGMGHEEAVIASISYVNGIKDAINSLEVKEVDISYISENLAEANEYLDYTSTGNLAHNKPMVSARLKNAIRGLFDARLFKLTHDEKYRMENLGLKVQKGE